MFIIRLESNDVKGKRHFVNIKIFSFLFYQSEDSKGEVPRINNEAVNLLSVNDPKAKVVPVLPNSRSCSAII